MALGNHDAEKEEKANTIVISECSEAQAMKLINYLGLDICNPKPDEIAALAEDDFSAFPWRSPFDEDAQSNDIVKHLRAHAGSFLDSLGFKLADTHSNKSCLDFESSMYLPFLRTP